MSTFVPRRRALILCAFLSSVPSCKTHIKPPEVTRKVVKTEDGSKPTIDPGVAVDPSAIPPGDVSPPLSLDLGSDVLTNKAVLVHPQSKGVASWKWTQKSGPGKLVFSNPEGAEAQVSADMDGSYVIQVEGTATNGSQVLDELTFSWDTQGPEVKLSEERKAFEPITVEAVVSSDAVDLLWVKTSGRGNLEISEPKKASTKISADAQDIYVLTLNAKDQAGNVTSKDMKIIWNTLEPMVMAGDDILTNKPVTLNALSNGSATFEWTGPAELTFSQPQEARTEVTAKKDGVYKIRVTAKHINGLTAQDEVQFEWDKTAPKLVISAGALKHGMVALEAKSDSVLKSGKWSTPHAPDIAFFENPAQTTSEALVIEPGEYVFRFTATDLAGNTSHEGVYVDARGKPLAGVLDVTGGIAHVCALLESKAIRCWGLNYQAVVNPAAAPSAKHMSSTINLGVPGKPVSLTSTLFSTCASLVDGVIRCWGKNLVAGGSGIHSLNLNPGEQIQALSMSSRHICGLLKTGDVKCWGQNLAATFALPPEGPTNEIVFKLAAGKKATGVQVSENALCVLVEDGQVKCWGDSSEVPGLLGSAITKVPAFPQDHVNLGANRKATALTAGRVSFCAILDDASMRCWGKNSLIGASASEPKIVMKLPTSVKLMSMSFRDNSTCIHHSSGVTCTGSGFDPELGKDGAPYYSSTKSPSDIFFGTKRKAMKLTGLENYYCAALDDKTMRCWGKIYNLFGQKTNVALMPSYPVEPTD